MSTNLDQPMQGKGILTARGFTDGNGFGSRYAYNFGTYPKDGVSYYIVYFNHTNNITKESEKVKFFFTFFNFFLFRKSLAIKDLRGPGRCNPLVTSDL